MNNKYKNRISPNEYGRSAVYIWMKPGLHLKRHCTASMTAEAVLMFS